MDSKSVAESVGATFDHLLGDIRSSLSLELGKKEESARTVGGTTRLDVMCIHETLLQEPRVQQNLFKVVGISAG